MPYGIALYAGRACLPAQEKAAKASGADLGGSVSLGKNETRRECN